MPAAGYEAKASGVAAAEPIRMQAIDLGKYLLYGKAQDFLAAGSGDTTAVARPPAPPPTGRSRGRMPYYRGLASAVRAGSRATVILNPGSVPDEAYMAVADVVVTFEGTSSAYAAARFPGWTEGYGAERFAHLVHDAAGAEPGVVERLAAGRHAANAYVTDDAGANPWDTLPASYAETSAALAGCGVPVA